MNTKYLLTILGICFMSLALGFSTALAGGDANESDYHSEFFDNDALEMDINRGGGGMVSTSGDWERTTLDIDSDYHSGFFENDEENTIILKVGREVVGINGEAELNRDMLDTDSDYHTGFFENEVAEENGKTILCLNCAKKE